MAKFDFTLDQTFIGATVGPPDGLIVDLSMQQPPSIHENPYYDEGQERWKAGYFQLRAQPRRDLRPYLLRSVEQLGAGMSWSGGVGWIFVNRSVAYRGNLVVLAVPRGSVWSLTLSDQPVVRTPPSMWDNLARIREAMQREPVCRFYDRMTSYSAQ